MAPSFERNRFGLWAAATAGSLAHSVRGMLGRTDHTPEASLFETPHLDPRLLPRAPMSNAEIDTHLLNELGKLGLKRGKLITEQSHPELTQVWREMSRRARFAKPPQLILVENKAPNALTVSPEEVVVTTGLFKLFDLREVAAVLGHEFGHENGDHQTPRMAAMALFGGAGVIAGDRFAHGGGIGGRIQQSLKNDTWFKRTLTRIYGAEGKPLTVLGSLAWMAIGGAIGGIIANQVAVRPTELDADKRAIAISGDPQALISALQKLHTAHPQSGLQGWFSYLRSGYPSTPSRIARLKELSSNSPPLVPAIDVLNRPSMPATGPSATAHPGHAVTHIAVNHRLETPSAVQQLA